ncbi:MAG: isoprenylcysteine carboxylmethyltransferase family protein [Pirellulales bacterium]
MAAILAMLALGVWLPGRQVIDGPWRWAGVVPIAAGLGLVLWVARLFRRHGTTIKPGQVSSDLLTGGPFRFSRNPIYLGMTSLLIGVAIALGSLTPLLVIPVFVALVACNVIPVEESMLQEKFGEQYTQYQARVRRWI